MYLVELMTVCLSLPPSLTFSLWTLPLVSFPYREQRFTISLSGMPIGTPLKVILETVLLIREADFSLSLK